MAALLHRELSDRGRLVLTGGDRVRFLHGMTTNDIEALSPGQGCHAAMLTVKGKLVGELVVYADAERLILSVDARLRQRVREVLEKHMILDDVELVDVTDETREVGLYGA